jgi:hypothetical protein
MKSVSQDVTLKNSLLQAMSDANNNSQALPVPVPPTTSPEESEEAQRKRLLEILEFAIAIRSVRFSTVFVGHLQMYGNCSAQL